MSDPSRGANGRISRVNGRVFCVVNVASSVVAVGVVFCFSPLLLFSLSLSFLACCFMSLFLLSSLLLSLFSPFVLSSFRIPIFPFSLLPHVSYPSFLLSHSIHLSIPPPPSHSYPFPSRPSLLLLTICTIHKTLENSSSLM